MIKNGIYFLDFYYTQKPVIKIEKNIFYKHKDTWFYFLSNKEINIEKICISTTYDEIIFFRKNKKSQFILNLKDNYFFEINRKNDYNNSVFSENKIENIEQLREMIIKVIKAKKLKDISVILKEVLIDLLIYEDLFNFTQFSTSYDYRDNSTDNMGGKSLLINNLNLSYHKKVLEGFLYKRQKAFGEDKEKSLKLIEFYNSKG